MFKRFLVIDLFHKNKDINVSEWIDADKLLPSQSKGIYKVRLSSGDEILAYYCDDKIANLALQQRLEPSYWWCHEMKKPIYDVTHWGKTND